MVVALFIFELPKHHVAEVGIVHIIASRVREEVHAGLVVDEVCHMARQVRELVQLVPGLKEIGRRFMVEVSVKHLILAVLGRGKDNALLEIHKVAADSRGVVRVGGLELLVLSSVLLLWSI